MSEGIQLNESERLALDQFLSENWRAFEGVALDYLTEEEIESLGSKLAGG